MRASHFPLFRTFRTSLYLHTETTEMDTKEFLKELPGKIPEGALDGKNTLFHFNLQDDGQYTVKVEDGKMTIEEGLIGDPKCVVTASAATLGKVISGNMNPMMAVMSGKLKISNLTEMMTYAKIFGLKI